VDDALEVICVDLEDCPQMAWEKISSRSVHSRRTLKDPSFGDRVRCGRMTFSVSFPAARSAGSPAARNCSFPALRLLKSGTVGPGVSS
jgi:hypothetical protein